MAELAIPAGQPPLIPDRPLVGRSADLSRLLAHIDPRGACRDRVLVMLGEAGIGKSALLAAVASHAAARGLRVLSVAGRERESSLAFAGLQLLLRPVLIDALALRGRQAGELRSALGLNGPVAEPDLLLAASALPDLLAAHAESANGVLVLVDDSQWMDTASLDVLALAARRPAGAPVAMILAARGNLPPSGFERDIPEQHLAPLSMADAGELLDVQPDPPRGRDRAQVLAQAAGNPLALIELTRAITSGLAAECNWAGLPLPLTDRLHAMFTAGLRKVPAPTRHALLLAAVADGADRAAVVREAPGLTPSALAPAEELGLITVDATGPRFRHPLVRSAAYHDAPFASRAAAHREVADALRDEPDRRAWHLGAATLRPDADVAALLAATAPRAGRRGGAAAMALALERAADLSANPDDEARRLAAAAEAAVSAGQAGWARDLATRALAHTQDGGLRMRGQRVAGLALTLSGRPASAGEILVPLARETARHDPEAAWSTLGIAATAAYQAGDPSGIRAVGETVAMLPPAAEAGTQAARLWVLAVTGQVSEAATLLRQFRRTGMSAHCLSYGGAAAWLTNQTSCAVGLLPAATSMASDPAMRAVSHGPLAALGWAFLDAGRWDDALQVTAEMGNSPETDVPPTAAGLIGAMIEAARGNAERARPLIAAALAADQEHSRLVTARARHALGLAGLGEGDYETAFGHLRQLFGDDGTPCHYHASYLAVGDLALAAARAGCRLEGREILKKVSARLGEATAPCSARLRQLLARADGILADPSTPAAYPDDVLSDSDGDQWPFERAQLRLEVGEWLRRHRRINEAKPVLSAALEAFQALQAQPWAHRAEAELRACGIATPGSRAGAAGLRELTPQQRQIVGLAAQGLSNCEIAERLFLSPRTVASHLYRSFPKLGVAGRHQLHALLAQADHPA